MRIHAWAALLAVLAYGSAGWSQDLVGNESAVDGQGPRSSIRINVDVERVPLNDVMEQIGRQVGRNILVDPNVQEVVTVALRDIPWTEAVDVIARMTRCEKEDRHGVIVLTQPPKVSIQFTDANVRTVLQLLAAYSGKNIIISQDVRGTITLDLKDVHWLRALHAIVRTVGEFEVVEEEGQDLLRVVSRTSIEQQLETVVIPLRYVRPPAHYRARPPASSTGGGAGASGASTVFIGPQPTPLTAQQLDPANNFTLFRALQAVVQSSQLAGATLQYDQGTNSFIVTATRPLIQQIRAIINQIDIEPAQIFCEVRFVATRDNNFQEYGIEFGEGSDSQGLTASGPFDQSRGQFLDPFINREIFFADPTTPPGQPAQGLGPSAGQFPFRFSQDFSDVFNLLGVIDLRGLNMSLNLIDRDNRSRVIQSPSLFMLDNQDAVIFVGEQVPYAQFSAQPDANGNVVQTLQEGQRSPVAVGFSLFVQPHVVPDVDRINLTVIPRVTELTGSTAPSNPGFELFNFGGNQNLFLLLPRLREQALVTQIMLDNTNTAVLGGLLTEQNLEITKRVPVLSSLPLLGSIFTNKQLTRQVENLTILITPTIIRNSRTIDTIFMRATQRLEETDYFYKKFEAPAEDEKLGYEGGR